MASFGHVAVGMAAGRAYVLGGRHPAKAMLVFSLIALWPDVDAVGFALRIPYASPFGHRGATHSLVAALAVGLATFGVAWWRHLPLARTTVFATVVALSHGLLDTLTYGGGYGCALLWPLSVQRFWAPVRFIPVAPIGMGMLSAEGLRVVATEVVLFAPFWLYAVWPRRQSGQAGRR